MSKTSTPTEHVFFFYVMKDDVSVSGIKYYAHTIHFTKNIRRPILLTWKSGFGILTESREWWSVENFLWFRGARMTKK